MRLASLKAIAGILRAAKAKLTPETWAQGDYAFDADGNLCNPTSPKAVCFCAVGAVRSFDTNPKARIRAGVRRHTIIRLAEERLDTAAEDIGGFTVMDPEKSPAAWLNDHTDLPTVHRMFDMAIEATGVT